VGLDQAAEGILIACACRIERPALFVGSARPTHVISDPGETGGIIGSLPMNPPTRRGPYPRTMTRSPKCPVVHLELRTEDLSGSAALLTELLGWRVERVGVGDRSYTALDLGGLLGGGIAEDDRPPARWLPYVEVDDIDRMTARGRLLGASVILRPREGPAGWRSILATPSGAEVALWQPKR
jgi:predicted enzyme related to lactoylglutathione lyase